MPHVLVLTRIQAGQQRCCRLGSNAAVRVPAGKSSMAQQLASRLNMPNVLQTDIICEVRLV